MGKFKLMSTLNLQIMNKIIIFAAIMTLATSSCQNNQYSNHGVCYECPFRCDSCVSDSHCLSCQQGAYMRNNLCFSCSVTNCKTCPNNVCAVCMDSYEYERFQCHLKSDYRLILTSIGLALFGLLVFLCCACWIIRHCRLNRQQTSNLSNYYHQNDSFHNLNSNSFIKIDENWKFNTEALNRQDQLCSICLDNQPNIFLKCNHPYHVFCIASWALRNSQCPLCKRSVFGLAKICCCKCWKYQKQIRVQSLRQINSNMKFICDSCEAQVRQQVRKQMEQIRHIKIEEQFVQVEIINE